MIAVIFLTMEQEHFLRGCQANCHLSGCAESDWRCGIIGILGSLGQVV